MTTTLFFCLIMFFNLFIRYSLLSVVYPYIFKELCLLPKI